MMPFQNFVSRSYNSDLTGYYFDIIDREFMCKSINYLCAIIAMCLTFAKLGRDVDFQSKVSKASQCSIATYSLIKGLNAIIYFDKRVGFTGILDIISSIMMIIVCFYLGMKARHFESSQFRKKYAMIIFFVMGVVGSQIYNLVVYQTNDFSHNDDTNFKVVFDMIPQCAPYCQIITNHKKNPNSISRANLGKLFWIWVVPFTTFINSINEAQYYRYPSVYVIQPYVMFFYFIIGFQLNICQTSQVFLQEQVQQQNNRDDEYFRMDNPNATTNDNTRNEQRVFQFTKKLGNEFLKQLGADYECSICLQNQKKNPNETAFIEENSEPSMFDECVASPCNHYFHRGCFKHWISKNEICPLCRKDLKPYQYNEKHQI